MPTGVGPDGTVCEGPEGAAAHGPHLPGDTRAWAKAAGWGKIDTLTRVAHMQGFC